jgi:transposase
MTLPCSLPRCRTIRTVHDGPDALLVVAEARRARVRCPDCRTTSAAGHSRYQRQARDLPASGRPVCLRLTLLHGSAVWTH